MAVVLPERLEHAPDIPWHWRRVHKLRASPQRVPPEMLFLFAIEVLVCPAAAARPRGLTPVHPVRGPSGCCSSSPQVLAASIWRIESSWRRGGRECCGCRQQDVKRDQRPREPVSRRRARPRGRARPPGRRPAPGAPGPPLLPVALARSAASSTSWTSRPTPGAQRISTGPWRRLFGSARGVTRNGRARPPVIPCRHETRPHSLPRLRCRERNERALLRPVRHSSGGR